MVGLFFLSFVFGCAGLHCYGGFSLVAVSRGYSLDVVSRLSVEVTSLVVEHRLKSCCTWASLFCGMWDLPRPRIEPVSPALAGRFFTNEPPGKPPFFLFIVIIFNLGGGRNRERLKKKKASNEIILLCEPIKSGWLFLWFQAYP